MSEEVKRQNFLSKIKDNNVSFYSLLLFVLIVGLVGGVLGGYFYNDVLVKRLGTAGSTFSNIKVDESSAVIDVAKKASPSVVSITGTQSGFDFFGQNTQSQSSGTGFIVTNDGLIITNKHVVSDTNASYSVFTNDGKEYKAEIKAIDPLNDLAFLKINAKDLPTLSLGNSDDIKVGQRVVAIGNALGQYQNSVTSGVVSAIGRAIQAGDGMGTATESLENVIQTDAAINPGNSGGPLVNLAGQAIGINTAVDQQGESIGFAIPINVAKSALESVLTKGKVVRPVLGVRYVAVTKELASRNNLPVNQGAYLYGGRGVSAVVSGSPAAKAGLKEGDIITKINNQEIDSTHSLSGILTKQKVGDEITIIYLRDGKKLTAKVRLDQSN